MARDPRWSFGRRLSRRHWRSAEADVREEMALHIEMRTLELQAQGVSASDARAQAEREIGAPELVAPVASRLAAAGDRRRLWSQWWDEVRQDLRSAWRSSHRAPGFTALVVMTIALGLGANAAIFGVVNVAVFTPLPFDPDNTLVRVREVRRSAGSSAVVNVDASRRMADAVATMPTVFRESVAVSGTGRTMTRGDSATRVAAMRVGPGFTRVVGITPVMGRTFTADEEQAADSGGTALISHRLWQSAFGGSPTVVGQTFVLDGRAHTLVGVLPMNFHVPYDTDVWFPSRFGENERSIFILARLADGVSIEQARAALHPVADELNRRYPDVMRGLGATAVSAREFFVDNEDRVAVMLMAAVGVLLLIACTNVALLLTTRFASRQTEVAMRAALGCSRSRQVRQFVTEGVALFVAGGLLGMALAALLKDSLIVLLPENIAHEVGLSGIPLDWRLISFTGALAVMAGMAFGLLAAMRTTRADLHAVMKSSSRSVAGSSSRGVLGGLVVAEVALAVTLIFAAGVMVEAFTRLSTRDLGFRTRDVVSARIDLTADRYTDAAARRQFVEQLVERVSGRPGVEAAGITTVNPLCCGNWGARAEAEGHPAMRQADAPILQHFIVSPGYFPTVERRLVEGRNFTSADRPGGAPVLIVSRATANRFWPGESAIGKRMRRWSSASEFPWMTIVGVVEDAIESGDYQESWYQPHAQNADGPSATGVHLAMRGPRAAALTSAVREVVAELDSGLAAFEIRALDDLVAENLQQDRLGAWVSSVFGAAGLLLAALGLYGVLTFVVSGDRTEIAVRRALGATGAQVTMLILGRGARLVAVGLVFGALTAWGTAHLLPRWFPEARPDAGLIAVALLTLSVAAAISMAAPVRRALRLDPIEAMRQ